MIITTAEIIFDNSENKEGKSQLDASMTIDALFQQIRNQKEEMKVPKNEESDSK